MVKKKSYNPFKMWGSWVGAVILGYYGWSSLLNFRFDLFDVMLKIGIPQNFFQPILNTLGTFILHGALGFLIGWAIHSLFRRFRK